MASCRDGMGWNVAVCLFFSLLQLQHFVLIKAISEKRKKEDGGDKQQKETNSSPEYTKSQPLQEEHFLRLPIPSIHPTPGMPDICQFLRACLTCEHAKQTMTAPKHRIKIEYPAYPHRPTCGLFGSVHHPNTCHKP
jgi:hypothetical protein